MGTVVLLIVALLMPTAAGCLWVGARRAHAAWERRGRSARAADRPLDRLAADLRRLHRVLGETENAPALPKKHQRCQAIRAAYLDTLTTACRRMQVSVPAGERASQADIYRMEAELRRRGLDVRAN